MKRPLAAITLVAALAMIAAAGPARAADASGTRWSPLRDELLALQQRHHVPALVLVILDEGRPVLVHAGTPDGRGRFGPGAPFRWGSISKSVTALVALEAARRQGVSLDTPLADIVPDAPIRNPWAEEAPVRLEHLLELTAGLSDLTREEFDDNVSRPLGEALARHPRTLLWPPGLQTSYTNVAPGFTAAAVEVLTGIPFEDAARALVFDPLGMAGASYRPVPGLPGGYRADGRTEIPYWHVTFRAFGGLNASPRAMARFLEALLNQGVVSDAKGVSAESVRRMFQARASLGARRGLAITYGSGLYGWVRHGHLFYGHGGDADGYRSRFGLLPGARRGYLIGIDVDDPALLRRMRRLVEDRLTADVPAPAPPPPAIPATRALQRYAGVYYPSSSRFRTSAWRDGDARRARIEVAGHRLRMIRNGRSTTLVPLGGGRFRRGDDPAVSVVFAELNGVTYLQGELGNFVRIDPGPCPDFLPVCRR